jgi:ketosteroid isomerase-like protein
LSLVEARVRVVDDTSTARQAAHAYVDLLERRDWSGLAVLLTDDVVYEMPQTRERIRGKDAFLRFNRTRASGGRCPSMG